MLTVKRSQRSQVVVVHTFNPSTWEAEADGFLSSRSAWSTRVSSRTARAVQRNPVFKKQKKCSLQQHIYKKTNKQIKSPKGKEKIN